MINLDYFDVMDEDNEDLFSRVHVDRQDRSKQKKGGHYRLLASISKQVDNFLIYDIGSRCGLSALSLGINPSNKVISWDIEDNSRIKYPHNFEGLDVEFRLKDIFDEPSEIFSLPDIILLDLDPHNGIQEKKFLDILDETDFTGLLIMDDINYRRWPPLKKVFNDIEITKTLLPFGHTTGTGLVWYSERILVSVVFPKRNIEER